MAPTPRANNRSSSETSNYVSLSDHHPQPQVEEHNNNNINGENNNNNNKNGKKKYKSPTITIDVNDDTTTKDKSSVKSSLVEKEVVGYGSIANNNINNNNQSPRVLLPSPPPTTSSSSSRPPNNNRHVRRNSESDGPSSLLPRASSTPPSSPADFCPRSEFTSLLRKELNGKGSIPLSKKPRTSSMDGSGSNNNNNYRHLRSHSVNTIMGSIGSSSGGDYYPPASRNRSFSSDGHRRPPNNTQSLRSSLRQGGRSTSLRSVHASSSSPSSQQQQLLSPSNQKSSSVRFAKLRSAFPEDAMGIIGGAADDDDDNGEMFIPESVDQMISKPVQTSSKMSRRKHMRQQSVEFFMAPVKGKEQRTRCRDVFFALLFLAQLTAVCYAGWKYGVVSIGTESGDGGGGDGGGDGDTTSSEEDHDVLTVEYFNVLKISIFSGIFACCLSGLALFFMTILATRVIQMSLVFSIALSFIWGTTGIGFFPQTFVPVTGVIAVLLCVGYTLVVWDRIPFASANVNTALRGIKDNLVTIVLAFFFQGLVLVWSLWWFYTTVGVYDTIRSCTGDNCLSGEGEYAVYAALAVSFYWTYEVMMNIVNVTVAGMIGKWWASSYYSRTKTMAYSLSRAMFFSFGSICLGSLFTAPIQITRQIAESFRPQRSENVLLCLQECLLCLKECIFACIDSLAESFNHWAFTYVGLYGYGFKDAGKNASLLFEKRGWSKIAADSLVTNVLLIFSLVIGGSTGFFALMMETLDDYNFTSLHSPQITAFAIGSVIGLVMSCVLLSVVTSAVHTVIIRFAGSPREFEFHHRQLSAEMCSSWKEVWPGCLDMNINTLNINTARARGGGHARSASSRV